MEESIRLIYLDHRGVKQNSFSAFLFLPIWEKSCCRFYGFYYAVCCPLFFLRKPLICLPFFRILIWGKNFGNLRPYFWKKIPLSVSMKGFFLPFYFLIFLFLQKMSLPPTGKSHSFHFRSDPSNPLLATLLNLCSWCGPAPAWLPQVQSVHTFF